MKNLFTTAAHDGRGLAGIEFAMVIPVLLLLLGGVADFGLAFWNKGLLASSVAQGAQYAFLTGTTVTATAIQGIIRHRLSLPATAVTVAGPECRCVPAVSATPATAVKQNCVLPCANGRLPGLYVVISARYAYIPILPLYSGLLSPVLVETATVRLK